MGSRSWAETVATPHPRASATTTNRQPGSWRHPQQHYLHLSSGCSRVALSAADPSAGSAVGGLQRSNVARQLCVGARSPAIPMPVAPAYWVRVHWPPQTAQ